MKTISGEKVLYKFKSEMEPVDRIAPGERIKFEANDCWKQQVTREDQVITKIDHDLLNPATGPVYIEGAEPGDILKIFIEAIDVHSHGSTVTVAGEGVLGDQIKESRVKIIEVKDGHALFNDMKIPIDPMIGVIGLAPSKEDGDWMTNTPWKHGGNMDTTDIKVGSTLYLPVSQEGALLALGDCHGIMGDGEICFTGLEIPADVTLKVDLIKNKKIEWPILETEDATMVIASGNTLEDAVYEASSQLVDLLMKALDYDREDAYMLASLRADMKISQIVNPMKTIRASIPKHIVTTKKIIDAI